MVRKIKNTEPVKIEEGNLIAVQDMNQAGMWNLYIRRPEDGFPIRVQWMHRGNIQAIFETEIPEL